MESRRVVVTGMGVISPVGKDTAAMWEALRNGRSGIGPITKFDTAGYEVKVAGEIRDFDPEDYMSPREARRTDPFSQYAVAALQEALAQSRLSVDEHNAYEIGAIIGSGVGGIWTYTRDLEALQARGPRRVSPFLIPAITVDNPAVQVALRTGGRGPNFGVSAACATGAEAIGEAFETIRRGHAQAIFTGGFEAAVTPIGVAAFDRMGALSRRNDRPDQASRPFDAARDGFVISDGGALLVLEELEFALRRGAEPLAELLSYAATSDAVHLTSPEIEGTGAAYCMTLALQRAGLQPEQVAYINAHGTGTPAGDWAETLAIKRAFGEYAYRLPVSSSKSMTGHLLGGAGSLESVICIQAMRHGLLPPTINLDTPDEHCDLDYVPYRARPADLPCVMSNSFGFGGHNVSLVFADYPRRG